MPIPCTLSPRLTQGGYPESALAVTSLSWRLGRRAAKGKEILREIRSYFPCHVSGQSALLGFWCGPIFTDDHGQGLGPGSSQGAGAPGRSHHVIPVHLQGDFYHSNLLSFPPEEICQERVLFHFKHASLHQSAQLLSELLLHPGLVRGTALTTVEERAGALLSVSRS